MFIRFGGLGGEEGGYGHGEDGEGEDGDDCFGREVARHDRAVGVATVDCAGCVVGCDGYDCAGGGSYKQVAGIVYSEDDS